MLNIPVSGLAALQNAKRNFTGAIKSVVILQRL
jgi:hypothetical protein